MEATQPATGSTIAMTARLFAVSMLVGVVLGACGASRATPSAKDISSANGSASASKTSRAGAPLGDPPSLQAAPAQAFTGQAVGEESLRDVTFTSSTVGYALGAIQNATVVAETTDSGAFWSAVGMSVPGLFPGKRTTVVGLGSTGGPLGPSGAVVGSAGSSTVWVSTDRFAKWRSVTLPAPFLAASGYAPGLAGNAAVPTSIGVNNASLVWIVAGPLPAGSGSPDGFAGSVGLFELDPLTATLTYQGDLLGAGWASGARLSSVRIARVNPTHAFAFVSKPTSTGVSAELVATANAGKSWSRLDDPCASLDIEVRLSAPSAEVVWMGCGSVPSAGNQDKAVFRSDDGGVSWHKVWNGVVYQDETIMTGYMSSLVAVNSAQAYLGLGRGPLLETTNGGATWTTAVPHVGGSGGVEQVDALNADDVWALIGSGGMWGTTDGTSWSQLVTSG